jgi:protein subunit release factor A
MESVLIEIRAAEGGDDVKLLTLWHLGVYEKVARAREL